MMLFGLVVSVILMPIASSLNIAFPLMCYGGHFGTLSTLFEPICGKHNCTVIETAEMCSKKVEPFRERFNLTVIKEHGLPNEILVESNIDLLRGLCFGVGLWYDFTYDIVKKLLTENEALFDLLITDQHFAGVLIAAEEFNVPVLVQNPGFPTGVEHFHDKFFGSIVDSVVMKYFFGECVDKLSDKRRSLGLPEMDYQGGFLMVEYSSHFPVLIPTSPSFYPEPHPSVEYQYFGGIRDEERLPKLSPELDQWITKDDSDVVYISLGTHAVLDKESFGKFVEKLYKIEGYRIIWAMSTGLHDFAKDLGVFEVFTDKFYIGGYMPQYNILKHDRVKIFVNHAGLGSIVDLIKTTVPGVFAPQFLDQFQNAKQMAKTELGAYIDSFDFDSLDKAVKAVKDKYDFYKTNLIRVEKEFASHEDPELIVSFVEKIANRKKTTVQYKLPFQLSSNKHHYAWKASVFLAYALPVAFIALVIKCVSKMIKRGTHKTKLS
ncbi:UDP-glucuronosyltransferase 1A6-like [Convolutriloba macropyga]|uniref:UDP-glucuronosyltransferase 1A6-like n=1 Tax=Convolutriloba macropyga TaxID=536237 RepID=UPI003F520BBA